MLEILSEAFVEITLILIFLVLLGLNLFFVLYFQKIVNHFASFFVGVQK